MLFFFLLAGPFVNDYWYITVPEAIYLVYLMARLIGPWGLLAWPAFTLAFVYNQNLTMGAVAAVAVFHIGVFLSRNFAGDQIAKKKKGQVDNGANGVPRMTGVNEDAQMALDRMKMHRDTSFDQDFDQDDDYGYDSCPYCGSDNTDGSHCYDCDEDF